MGDIGAVSEHAAASVRVEVATQMLKTANAQPKSVLALLDDAVEAVERPKEPGKGDHIDTTV